MRISKYTNFEIQSPVAVSELGQKREGLGTENFSDGKSGACAPNEPQKYQT